MHRGTWPARPVPRPVGARRVPRPEASRGPKPRPGTGTQREPGRTHDPWPRAVQNHVPGLVREPEGSDRRIPCDVQGYGEVRTRWMTRGSAYQSVHVDLGKRGSPTRSTGPRGPCPASQGPAVAVHRMDPARPVDSEPIVTIRSAPSTGRSSGERQVRRRIRSPLQMLREEKGGGVDSRSQSRIRPVPS